MSIILTAFGIVADQARIEVAHLPDRLVSLLRQQGILVASSSSSDAFHLLYSWQCT